MLNTQEKKVGTKQAPKSTIRDKTPPCKQKVKSDNGLLVYHTVEPDP
jgi:hypothetical protein